MRQAHAVARVFNPGDGVGFGVSVRVLVSSCLPLRNPAQLPRTLEPLHDDRLSFFHVDEAILLIWIDDKMI